MISDKFQLYEQPHQPEDVPETTPKAAGQSLATPQTSPSSDKVYIRWVAMKRALAHSRLRGIGTDRQCVASDTTISQLRLEACEGLSLTKSQKETTEEPPDSNT